MKAQNFNIAKAQEKIRLLERELTEAEVKIAVEQDRARRVERVRETYKGRSSQLTDDPLVFNPRLTPYYRELKSERFWLKLRIFWLKLKLKLRR